MKAFRFRGERLLDWRRNQADRARGAFVRAAETAREAAAQFDAAAARHEQASAEFVSAMVSPFSAADLERYRNWIARLETHVTACQRASANARVVTDRAAAELREATRQVKVIERLRERAEERHREAERQADMKLLDELAVMQFVRRKTERARSSREY